jgi:hypothetical protein
MASLLASLPLLFLGWSYPALAPEDLLRPGPQWDLAVQVNQMREKERLAPLAAVPSLMISAQKHAEDMARRGYFDHLSPEGSTPSERAGAEGYGPVNAENIFRASGATSSERVLERWMGSPGHRRNLLGDHREMGIGVAPGSGGSYWVIVFGSRSGVYPVVIEHASPRTRSADVKAYLHGPSGSSRTRYRLNNGRWSQWFEFRNRLSISLEGAGLHVLQMETQDRDGHTYRTQGEITLLD